MAEVNKGVLPDVIRIHVDQLVGQVCSRQFIGEDRSLHLGFGEVIRHKSVIAEADHGEWEIGTYSCSWRVVSDGRIVCGSQDAVDHIDELRQRISEVDWGRCTALWQPTDLDVRVEFEGGVFVDFLATISEDDEIVHIFFPNKFVIEFSTRGGWVAGPSDKPWPEKEKDKGDIPK